jgi:GAF domain-containing protein
LTDQKDKPVLDVQTLEKLLEAAYVLQEHSREMQAVGESLDLQSEQLRQEELVTQAALQKAQGGPGKRPDSHGDYTLTLAEIVEAQHQIQMRHLELDEAMGLVAERTAKITHANGAGIGILNGKKVQYGAGCGPTALQVGTEIPLETAACAACFRTGQVVRSENFNPEFLFDPEPIRKRGIESLIAVPIYHDGKIVGALEVYFEQANGFVEQDLHTCQLMAGLVTEAFARDAEVSWKKSLAVERNTMLEALEKLKPNLAALAHTHSAGAPDLSTTAPAAAVAAQSAVCRKCGTDLGAEERFCGKCGASRVSDGQRSNLQNKLASAWNVQVASAAASPQPPLNGSSRQPQKSATLDATFGQRTQHAGFAGDRLPDDFELLPLDLADLGLASDDTLGVSPPGSENPYAASAGPQLEKNEIEGTALVKAQGEAGTWTSASSAKDFLEALAMTRQPGGLRRFWNARRGDFYLAIAIILVAIALRWGIWSDHSVGASGTGTAIGSSHTRKPAPDAELSPFDKLLISLGLAEAPEAPEYKGNPDTQVWEDLHTALYYCPGSDLYGKTMKGKFTSQRAAQLDQFEPAYRKACD